MNIEHDTRNTAAVEATTGCPCSDCRCGECRCGGNQACGCPRTAPTR